MAFRVAAGFNHDQPAIVRATTTASSNPYVDIATCMRVHHMEIYLSMLQLSYVFEEKKVTPHPSECGTRESSIYMEQDVPSKLDFNIS